MKPAELLAAELALAGELENLRHELRRVKDGLERCGGRDHELEKKARVLADNISICERDLARYRFSYRVDGVSGDEQ